MWMETTLWEFLQDFPFKKNLIFPISDNCLGTGAVSSSYGILNV